MIVPPVSSRRAFTLIELLVVIAIIAILATLLFTVGSAAIESAKKVQAKNDATQIAAAISAYVAEYGKMPVAAGAAADVVGKQDVGYLWDALSPDLANPPTPNLNPRGINFLEIPKAKSKKNGREGAGATYFDPWGQGYYISMDGNYDNQLADPGGGGVVRKTILVWSKGNPEKPSFADPTKWIKSWE